MAVRSDSIALGNATGATTVLGTVPAGEVWLLKQLVISHVGNTSTTSLRYVRTGVANSVRAWREVMAADVVYRVNMWDVLEAGDVITLNTNAGTPATVVFALSGARLVL